MSEPTATNAAGEKVVLRGGQWVSLSGSAPATPAPSFPGVIQGRPKTASPLEMENLELRQRGDARDATTTALANQLTELTIEEKRAKAAEAAKQAAAASEGDSAARLKLMRLVGKLGSIGKDANDNGGWFETGASGSFSRNNLWAGSAGYDLGKDINSAQATLAFDALQAMRDASKTGGALGAISERELELLQSAVGNIDPNQSHESFLNNLEAVRQAYLSKLAMIDPQIAARMGYDGKKAESALLALNDAYTKEMGLDPAVSIDRSASAKAPVQQGNPPDIDAILAKYGVQ